MTIPTAEYAPLTALHRILAGRKGFTLIELLIVMSIVGILASIAVPNYKWGIVKAKEAVLREDLYNLRTTIDNFFADRGEYPSSLQDLKDKNYLRDIPKDPFTNANDTWKPTPPPPDANGQTPKGSFYDVHSGSDLIGTNGVAYNEW